MKTVLVTGGAGFIGSCYVLSRRTAGERVVNLDKLTYSGNIGNLASLDGDAEHIFVRGDIGDALLVRQLLHHYQPDAVINFAAESHVDRSIHDPDAFVRTNVLGTCTLLRGVLEWWKELSEERRNAFRFLHVSTDEVYGTLRPGDVAFLLSAGNVDDCTEAVSLLKLLPDLKDCDILADKAYGTKEIRTYLHDQSARYTIPPKVNTKQPWPFDKETYKRRNVIERFFNRLKEFRRAETRYDKRDDSFLAN